MSGFTGGRIHIPSGQPSGIPDISRKKQHSQQPRQLLSCTKCRERKVKCDRTKPCSACCARGAPKDCHFIAEGGDYAPIQQSYELRKLRTENLHLKERLRARKVPIEDDDSDPSASPESQLGERPGSSQKRRTTKQRRFQGSEWQDSLYFGSPGLASVINDFASTNAGPASASLAHLMPRGSSMYTQITPPTHPFATLFKATPEECIPQLLSCLPSDHDIFEYLNSFERRVNICSFPHMPMEITRSEIERFLSDRRKNAEVYPDMLALLFAAIALGGQHSVWDRAGEQWVADVMKAEIRKCDVFIAAAMQALRLASFMHKPSLLGIQTLIMLGPFLTNSGRFLDAWTLFGTTIRLAHSIGLHRHPKYLNPIPTTQREVSVRQALWWWMLHMDEQYSMTLGRPLGISGIGDCPWPHELTTNPAMLRFGEHVNHFTILARQILSSDPLSHAKIDDFTDRLRGLLETMPETLQFDESWIRPETEIPEWPLSAMAAVYFCKTHTYLVLLNRQRMDKHNIHPQTPGTKLSPSSFRSVNRTPTSYPSTPTSFKASLRGRALVLSSSEDILCAFVFFFRRIPAALIDWTIGQQAFNSCMILLLDAIENKRVTEGAMKAEQAYAVFKELEDNGVHKLASLAVDKISWGLQELRKVTQASTGETQTQERQRGHAGMQNAIQNESTPESSIADTVMGNTGLFLLEDPGLQGFVHEEWSPIAWTIQGDHSVSMKELENQVHGGASQIGGIKAEDVDHGFRSAEAVQGIRRSKILGPRPLQHTARSGKGSQPQSYTGPTSPKSFADSHQSVLKVTESRQREQRAARGYQVYQPQFSHAQFHEVPTGLESASSGGWEYEPFSGAPSRSRPLDNSPLASSDPTQAPPMQLRHNSCPTLPQSFGEPPILRATYSTPSKADGSTAPLLSKTPLRTAVSVSMGPEEASMHVYLEGLPHPNAPLSSTSVPPTFSARAAAPTASVADPRMVFSPSAEQDSLANEFSHGLEHEQQEMECMFPTPYSNATTPSAMMAYAESVSVEEWQKRIGGSGTGAG